ncbi:MAG: glucosyl transferase [Ignavibacteriaceae bacterium]
MKKNIFFFVFSFNLILLVPMGYLLIGCNTTDPPTPPETKATLTLALEDTSCTEVWLQLKTKDLTLPAELTLKQYTQTGDSLSQNFVLNTQDSILYIDSLLPNQNYFFQVSSEQHQVSSIRQQVTTMDTTSHNFTNWQTFTWGNVGSSTLFDVTIINENDIWAVGEIKIADSSLIGYATYNAIHWNGTSWELKKIMFYGVCGQTYMHPFPISSIFAFNENEIWVSLSGDQIAKIENGIQTETVCLPWDFGIKKIWGTSSSNVYIVGYYGNIAHYDGTNWNRIESGTTLNINDIWGDYNQKINEWEILAVASNEYSSFDRELIKINKNNSMLLSKSGIEEPLHSIWFKPNKKYYAVGSGTYEKTHLNEPEWKGDPLDITEYFENRVRANDINDVIAVGAFGEILHFNGYNWQSYISQTYLQNGTLLSVDIKNNLIVATGWKSQQAVLIIGQR